VTTANVWQLRANHQMNSSETPLLSPATPTVRILSSDYFLAGAENIRRTTVVSDAATWVRKLPRGAEIAQAFSLLREREKFDVVLAPGSLSGLLFAAWQRLLPGRRVPTILVDCLWSREAPRWRRFLKRWQMQFCLGAVDLCVVWAEREVRAYAKEFCVDESKFVYVPHHSTLHPHRYKFTVSNGGYIFAGGNGDRDYRTFVEAVRFLKTPCVIACTDDRRLAGIELPPHVRRVRATPEEFRQWLTGAMIVVVPMEGGQLHSGGQQSFLNAMAAGKPVIVTDPEGAGCYIENGVTGLLVPPGNSNQMREALQYLLDHEDRRREMGAKALAAARVFSVENSYDQICQLADELIQPRNEIASLRYSL
jgi:glycosyltransferase involved in cell wall biosynthesis